MRNYYFPFMQMSDSEMHQTTGGVDVLLRSGESYQATLDSIRNAVTLDEQMSSSSSMCRHLTG